jgi:hypothetical protein
MKIGIFGDSSAVWRPNQDWGWLSYCEQVNQHFSDDTINWYGANTGSLPRTIANLHKHKHLDLYIIFHSAPDYIYFPGWRRDFPLDEIKNTVKNPQALEALKEQLRRHSPFNYDNIKSELQFWLNVCRDEKLLQLNFVANLLLVNKMIQGKTVIHVPRSNVEKQLIQTGSFNEQLQELLKSAGTHPTYIPKTQHDKVALEMISMIEKIKQC